jgi:flagellar biosynthetic protein FlhB
MAEGAGERTERATPHKREEARKRGQVVKSAEVSSVALLLGGILALNAWSPAMLPDLAALFTRLLRHAGTAPMTPEQMPGYALEGGLILGKMLAPMLLALAVIGLAANLAQVGFLLSWEAVKPNLSKLDPVKGLSQLFSIETLAGLIREPIKIGLVGVVGYVMILAVYEDMLRLGDLDAGQIMVALGDMAFTVVLGIVLALAGLAALDYGYRWWKHERDLRMSKQEVKDETRQQEGNPEIKSRIRRMQQSMGRKRMLEAVPRADVVITNPTHLAVALRYDPRETAAPTVVAKGADYMAQRIREIAAENRVPVVENKPVARVLYETVEVDDQIPVEMYQAVAEILAFVYRLKGTTPGTR